MADSRLLTWALFTSSGLLHGELQLPGFCAEGIVTEPTRRRAQSELRCPDGLPLHRHYVRSTPTTNPPLPPREIPWKCVCGTDTTVTVNATASVAVAATVTDGPPAAPLRVVPRLVPFGTAS